MSQQIQITGGAKVRDLQDVIIGTSGVLSSVAFDVANGVPRLDSNGKILVSQLPNSVMEYKGTWNAATNTPTLANGTGNQGDVYLCNVAGTVNFGAGPISFIVGDSAVYSGSIWQRSGGATGSVTSVGLSTNGGAITIGSSPITTSGTITANFNGTNLQYVNGAGNLTTFPTLITSIGLSMPSAFSVANSPLTANGTIAVTGAGTTAQYIRGDGSLATFPTIATEAQRLITEVYNETGATLTKGTVVYINGGHGNLPTVTKAIATGDSTSAQTYGVVQTDITNMNNGYVVVIGSLGDLDTQAYPNGTQLYLSSTTAGAWTSTKQYAPAHLVYVGIVTRSHPTQGVVEVRIQNGFEMDELHNVSAQTPSNGGILQYVTSTGLWTAVAGTTTNIAEGTNLYYTDARARAALSFVAGSGAYNSTTGVITIPTNNNQITNGSNYITLGSLSAGVGISYNNTTGVITNSAPDQTVSLTAGAGISVSGTYPSFTIASTITQYTDALARAAISLTTTGTSGAATYNNTTGVLNIPQYADQFVGTVTSVAALTIGTSGTDLSSSVANSTTTPVITLNVPTASATNRGALSSADWTTFNNKQSALTNPVTGTGTTNYLPKFTGTSTIGNSAFYDGGGFGGFNSTGLGARTFIIQAANARPLALEMIEYANVHAVYVRPNNSGYNLISSNYISGGVYNPLALSGRENNTDLVLTTSGNVEIGNSAVANLYKLDVNGTGRFKDGAYFGASATGDIFVSPSSGYMYFEYPNSYGAIFRTQSGTQSLQLNASGAATFSSSVTANATSTFSNASSLSAIFSNGGSVSNYNSIELRGGTAGTAVNWQISKDNSTGNAFELAPSTTAGGTTYGSPVFKILNTGAATFTSSVTAQGYFALTTTSDAYAIQGTLSWNSARGTVISGKTASVFDFAVYGAAAQALITNPTGTSVISFPSGNVGIGTSSPDQKLTIQAAGTANGLISFKNSAGTTTNLIGQPNATGDVISTSSTDDLCFRTQNGNMLFALSNNEFARFTSGGSLLIGTTDDGGKLVSYSTTAATQIKAAGTAPAITFSNTVLSPTIGGVLGACTASSQFLSGTASGDMVLANQFSGFRLYVASYSGGVYLTSGATSWTANSDIRLKNINSHIENAVEKLSTLQTINFSYKDDKFKKQNLGLIAQEVEKIFPELIDKNGDGMLGVRYTELVPVLIKAVQELKAEIETLKNK